MLEGSDDFSNRLTVVFSSFALPARYQHQPNLASVKRSLMPEIRVKHANPPNSQPPRFEEIRHSSLKRIQMMGFMISVTQHPNSRGVKK